MNRLVRIEDDRKADDLEGGELIEFASTAWVVDSVSETSSGLRRVTAMCGEARLQFDIDGGAHVRVWVECKGVRP